MTNGAGNLVTIRDIDVPFWRIVMIMIKWSIAAIPATIILIAIWVLVMGLFAAMFGPHMPMNAPSPAPDLDKVIVLLTDGDNTQNRFSNSTSAIDSRTEKVCTNAKAANIKVYTVRVIDGNATLLRGCATKPEMFYDVDEATQLNSVFASIAQNLANLRIAK